MESKNIYNLIILDESGSMSSIERQAVSAMNETIQSIKKAQKENPDHHYFISLIVFEGNGMSGVKTVRDRVPAEKTETIKESEYCPQGCTPLYDAMGQSINYLDDCILKNDSVLVTIITDGMENSSEEYSGKAIKKLVEKHREKGWSFAYIGANQDAIEVARELNIKNSLNWENTEEGTEEMSQKLKRCISYYCDMAPSSPEGDMDKLFKE